MRNSSSYFFSSFVLFIGFFSVIIVSCSPARNTIVEKEDPIIPFQQLNRDSTLKNIRNTNSIKYIKAKGKAHYKDTNEDAEFGVTLLSVKDSAALIIIKKLGIEISRVLLEKRQYQILDRVNQNYVQGPYEQLPYALFTLLGLTTFQDILAGCSSCPQNLDYSLEEETQFYNLKGNSDSLMISNKLSKTNLKARQSHLVLPKATTIVECREFFSLDGFNIPKQIYIRSEFNSNADLHYLTIKWDYVKLDPLNGLKFNVPDHYPGK